MGSQLSQMTSSALQPLRAAVRRWSSALAGGSLGAPQWRPSSAVEVATERRVPSRRQLQSGCDCGQAALRRRGHGDASLAHLVLSTGYWIPVLGLVMLLAAQSQNG